MSKPAVFVHSFHHFEDVQLSAKEFYETLQQSIASCQFPEVNYDITTFSDRGLFSSRREYLEIRYYSYRYYVCAAPFGKNFFISWWLKERQSTWDSIRTWLVGGESRSFYEVDSQEIFASSVVSLIKELIRMIQSEKGLRNASMAIEA